MLRLSRLNFLFQEIVRETDGVDINDYKPHILKVRLRKSYPALKFHKSSETYLVYVDLSAEEIVHEAAASSSSSSSPSEDSRGEMTTTGRLESESATMNDSRLLYHAALTLNGIIQETAKKTPTLPARDLTLENALRVVPPQHTPALGIVPPQHTPALRVVPPQLFNFIAWASGISSLPSDERVEVSVEDSRKIVSSCQDIIALATSGR